MRRIVKVLGAVVGSLLLTILVVWVVSVVTRSPLLALGLGSVVLVLAALWWGRWMDKYASQSWFIRSKDVGATQAHDTLLQHLDQAREATHEQLRRRHPDAE
jgi:4-amino-4-deoxy-L-arabinose transferase-like glycosyltransferase